MGVEEKREGELFKKLQYGLIIFFLKYLKKRPVYYLPNLIKPCPIAKNVFIRSFILKYKLKNVNIQQHLLLFNYKLRSSKIIIKQEVCEDGRMKIKELVSGLLSKL